MNKRIRELANCAGEYTDYDTGLLTDEFILKFTELIVGECAEFARQYNLEKADRSYMIHQAMKDYLGVEE
jgi:hypothetical protein